MTPLFVDPDKRPGCKGGHLTFYILLQKCQLHVFNYTHEIYTWMLLAPTLAFRNWIPVLLSVSPYLAPEPRSLTNQCPIPA